MAEMVPVNGVCKYCGQNRVVMAPEGKEYTPEELDRIASAECDCSGAEEEAVVRKKKTDAADAIESILMKKNRKTVGNIMLAAVDAIARDRIKKVSINVDGESVCSMYIKGKKIIVESRQTKVEYSDGEAQDE